MITEIPSDRNHSENGYLTSNQQCFTQSQTDSPASKCFYIPVSPVVMTAGADGGPLPMLLTAMTYISYSV